ncbi:MULTISPECIES: hypothetical protein [unclassified Sulfitobacter]|uniref:hypothetical protein n=1 Tax=unclassified Sulfitobacter TaxID=196795 RepID=UPI0007C39BF9|nr:MULTISPECIES: hypothetical protein [unclassified Sulfitobacter]KZX94273.1 hypothetical protein A3720_04730 [Sulfitobacter sp. HI0021]KZX95400.1 hypothetical protein A3722_18490 [Sulfitobacter sp. HI0027]KZZ03160.1 hypothetical protein A3747_12830 [Sulfitobacter sp. HI0076]
MDVIEKIFSLPETVPSNQVGAIARELIPKSSKHGCNKQHVRILEALSELSEIQWRNYEKLDAITENEIEDYLIALPLEHIDLKIEEIITVIDRLGLQRAYEHLLNLCANGSLSEFSASELAEYREAAGENISNPYENFWK